MDKYDKLTWLSVFAFIALMPPLLSMFNNDGTFLGMPSLFVYLFSVWAGLIIVLYTIIRNVKE